METSSTNKLRKVCPQCSETVHVRRAVCGCGYAFPSKRRSRPDNVLQAKKQDRLRKANVRASETPEQTLTRQKQDKLRKSSTKASETPKKTATRLKQDRTHKSRMTASETAEQTATRQKDDKLRKSSMRASETAEQTAMRQKDDKLRKSASETAEQTATRQKDDKLHKSRKRALETPEQALLRKETNKKQMSCKRSRNMPVEEAISAFHSETRAGPDFVCMCCHRMMYRKSVILCNKGKYTKASPDLLNCVFSANLSRISSDGKEYMCKTCDRALLPVQARANGLQLSEIPPELSGLNALISLRVPFMKMVALPTGKQRSIHGPAVNVPSKVDTICNVLPRLPSQSELVPMKLKRKVAYKGHYMYDYIRPQKVLDALRYRQTTPCMLTLISMSSG